MHVGRPRILLSGGSCQEGGIVAVFDKNGDDGFMQDRPIPLNGGQLTDVGKIFAIDMNPLEKRFYGNALTIFDFYLDFRGHDPWCCYITPFHSGRFFNRELLEKGVAGRLSIKLHQIFNTVRLAEIDLQETTGGRFGERPNLKQAICSLDIGSFPEADPPRQDCCLRIRKYHIGAINDFRSRVVRRDFSQWLAAGVARAKTIY
ncbi:MAG: hypothetical protein ACD_75C01367G0004 [uncultured bacterium]|nr:MAG: hypothetical protein ACD_75C01367G0004 [uncultured bacterium]